MIIFNENIVHEVNPHKKKYTMVRLFTGWRLTNSTDSLIPDLSKILEDQSVVPIKSKQMPRMYSKSHMMFHHKMLEHMAENLIDKCIYEHTFKSGKLKGKTKVFPNAVSPSLKELGIMYPEYTHKDIEILYPC